MILNRMKLGGMIGIAIAMLLASSISEGFAQDTKTTKNTNAAKLEKLKAAVEASPNDLQLHQEYIKAVGLKNPELEKQYALWAKQFPKSVNVSYSLAEAYYKSRDPKSVKYIINAYMAGDTAARLLKMLKIAEAGNWDVDIPRRPNTIDSLKRVVEKNPDNLLPVQQYVFILGNQNDTAITQINAWMKQFPRSVPIPLALGESFYDAENPKAKPYLLKVVELQPENAKVWDMLSIDAQRWGDDELSREYIRKASLADPNNISYASSYTYSFRNTDPVMWRKKVWELVKKFPDNEEAANSLYYLSLGAKNNKEKIDILEQLKKLYPPAKFTTLGRAMGDLYELYLQEGFTDKAIALATSMENKDGFPEKLELAKRIATVRRLIKEKKNKEAQEKIMQVKVPRYSKAADMMVLLKAEAQNAAGLTQEAYNDLLAIQAKTPGDNINEAIVKYGAKLGKSAEQIEKETWEIRDKAAKPAPAFELELYTSNAKTKLEDYKGKVILLTFWFPGCGPCRGEMPHFQNVVNKYDKKDLAYLGINVAPDQDEYVLPFMKGTKFSFTPLHDHERWAENAYHVRGEPTNFLIDQEGKIIYSNFMIDGDNERMLELMINSMLKKS